MQLAARAGVSERARARPTAQVVVRADHRGAVVVVGVGWVRDAWLTGRGAYMMRIVMDACTDCCTCSCNELTPCVTRPCDLLLCARVSPLPLIFCTALGKPSRDQQSTLHTQPQQHQLVHKKQQSARHGAAAVAPQFPCASRGPAAAAVRPCVQSALRDLSTALAAATALHNARAGAGGWAVIGCGVEPPGAAAAQPRGTTR
jgi:hypothetical protein